MSVSPGELGDSDGSLVDSAGSLCDGGCGCPGGDSPTGCSKVRAVLSGLVGCLADLNGRDLYLCFGYDAGFDGSSGIMPVYRTEVKLGVAIAYVLVSTTNTGGRYGAPYVVEVGLGPGRTLAIKNAIIACAALDGSPIPTATLPSFYESPDDSPLERVGDEWHGDLVSDLQDEASVIIYQVPFEECCEHPCGFVEWSLAAAQDEPPLVSRTAGIEPYSCYDCCRVFTFSYGDDGDGPELDFETVGTTGGTFLTTDSLGYDIAFMCSARGFGGSAAPLEADVPVIDGFTYVRLQGYLYRTQKKFVRGTDEPYPLAADAPPDVRDIWLYEEYLYYQGDGFSTTRLWRARWANPQGPCPPPSPAAWNNWPGEYRESLGLVNLPLDDTAPTQITVSTCPACGCVCAQQYLALYDSWAADLDTSGRAGWSVPAAVAGTGGCHPTWSPDAEWSEPCPAELADTGIQQQYLAARYVPSFAWLFTEDGDCACDLSGSPCTFPDSIDPPGFTPGCLTCPDLSDCCGVFRIDFSVDGVPEYAIVQLEAGGTFTSNNPKLAYACYHGVFRPKITIPGRVTGLGAGPFYFVALPDGEGCPTFGDYAPVGPDVDGAVLITGAVCMACDTAPVVNCASFPSINAVLDIGGSAVSVRMCCVEGTGWGSLSVGATLTPHTSDKTFRLQGGELGADVQYEWASCPTTAGAPDMDEGNWWPARTRTRVSGVWGAWGSWDGTGASITSLGLGEECPPCEDPVSMDWSSTGWDPKTFTFTQEDPTTWTADEGGGWSASATLSGSTWTVVVQSIVAGPCFWTFTIADNGSECLTPPVFPTDSDSATGEGDCHTATLAA